MTMIKLSETVTPDFVKSNKNLNPQMKQHLEYMLKTKGHDWFDKAKYTKELGYEGKDVEIFGRETKGNMISNFRWYFTKFNEMKIFEVQASSDGISEIQKLKDRVRFLEETLRELGWSEEQTEEQTEE